MSIAKHRFKNLPPHLTCSLCDGVLVEPRQCPRGHFFCRTCITTWISNNPSCRDCFVDEVLMNDLTMDQLTTAPVYIVGMINDLDVTCDNAEYGCREVVKLSQLAKHVKQCPISKIVDENNCARYDDFEKTFKETKEMNNELTNKITRIETDHANNQAKLTNDNLYLKAELVRVRKHRDELAAQNASLVDKQDILVNPISVTPIKSPQFSPSSSSGSFQDLPPIDLNTEKSQTSSNESVPMEPVAPKSSVSELLMELKSQKIIDQQLVDIILLADFDRFFSSVKRSDKLSILAQRTITIANMVQNIKRECRVLLRIECAFTSVVLANYFPFCNFVVYNSGFLKIKEKIKDCGFESLITSKRLTVYASLNALDEKFDVLIHKYQGKVPEDVFMKLKPNARIYSIVKKAWRKK